ncbi:alpha/beta fold hydrolase [Alkalihalobacillus pseudalcaliphilus]|uniref:alpha/beta fold hydrolase n=1 Tax=Alkalihalobacillus pseudalcaliphilus TaxID=79884 RepID=UPI00064DA582|nr:alpha/beta hydrolase [Alkalihalobacillus pseudalcaliphilus]KMK76567.1 hydrolase [Alkalihalobacillus pseudalcaliphilus]
MSHIKESKTVYLLNSDIYYEYYFSEEHKNKPVLVFIHGFISSLFCFRKIVPALKKNYNCLLFDLPGFGRSGKLKGFRYSFDNYANTVLRLTELLNIEKMIIIGHSMGGQVGLYTALKKTEWVQGLILLNSSGYLKKVKRSYLYASYLPFADTLMKWWISKKDYQTALETVVFNRRIIDAKLIDGYRQPLQEQEFYRSMLYLIRDREGDLSKEQLLQVDQPCLLIWGEADHIIPYRIGQKLANDLRNSQLVCLKNTGHLTPEERPKLVIKYIQQFLKKHV